MNNLCESEMIDFLVTKLQGEGSISLSEFKKSIIENYILTEHDLSVSPTRPNELRYEQRVRNMYASRMLPKNIKYENGIFTLSK